MFTVVNPASLTPERRRSSEVSGEKMSLQRVTSVRLTVSSPFKVSLSPCSFLPLSLILAFLLLLTSPSLRRRKKRKGKLEKKKNRLFSDGSLTRWSCQIDSNRKRWRKIIMHKLNERTAICATYFKYDTCSYVPVQHFSSLLPSFLPVLRCIR